MKITQIAPIIGAADLGFGWSKIAVEGKKPWRQPSVIGEPREIYHEDVKKDYLQYGFISDDPRKLEFEAKYFIGELALKHSDIRYSSTGKDKAKAWHTRVLLETGLGLLAPDRNINLVTGLPIDFYNSQKSDFEELINEFNEGESYFIREGSRESVEARPHINKYKIIPQHLGGAMNHFLDDQGREKVKGECMKPWLVIDPGRYTLGLLGLENMEVMKESSSPALGVEVSYKLIQDELKKQLGRTPDRFMLDSYVLAGEYDGINLFELREYAFKAWATQIQFEIDSFNRDFYGYIIVGGWADQIATLLSLPVKRTFKYDQWANLNGYMKMGKRLWRQG